MAESQHMLMIKQANSTQSTPCVLVKTIKISLKKLFNISITFTRMLKKIILFFSRLYAAMAKKNLMNV